MSQTIKNNDYTTENSCDIEPIYHLPTDLIKLLNNPIDDLKEKKLISSIDYFKHANKKNNLF
jgi:hypothetical protein